MALSFTALRDLYLEALDGIDERGLDCYASVKMSDLGLRFDQDYCVEVMEKLLPVKGIGPWTAEMFLIFSLGRLDVLPVGDLGLRTRAARPHAARST